MKYNDNINDLYASAGYTFKETEYLSLALTHSSYANEFKNDKSECNERLEFFGDSVLSILVSEYMFFKYPDLPEGELTRTRAAVICEETLFLLANKINLGAHIKLGKGEEHTGGRERKSIVADAFEAFLAAVYIDGGRKSAEDFLYPLIIPEIEKHIVPGGNVDYKTLLQQFVQSSKGVLLEYVVTKEEGPHHDKVFFVDAVVDGSTVGRGTGKSKRRAEQQAAKDALELFGVIEE